MDLRSRLRNSGSTSNYWKIAGVSRSDDNGDFNLVEDPRDRHSGRRDYFNDIPPQCSALMSRCDVLCTRRIRTMLLHYHSLVEAVYTHASPLQAIPYNIEDITTIVTVHNTNI